MGKSKDAFRTISEVADWLDTQAHVLRFWESKFTQVKPVKRAGGRRYYRPADMLLLGGIKKLLHDDGMTIKGAQKLLREKGIKYVAGLSQPLEGEQVEEPQDEIELADVTPPPVEDDRGTVLSFARPDDAKDEAPAETDVSPETTASEVAEDQSPASILDAEGDMFAFHSAPSAPVQDTPGEDAEEVPDQDAIPSFVQRVTPKAPVTEDTNASAPSKPAATEETAPAGMAPATSGTEPDDAEVETSLLADIATMTSIAPENRAEVATLLDRLDGLCKRIEMASNG